MQGARERQLQDLESLIELAGRAWGDEGERVSRQAQVALREADYYYRMSHYPRAGTAAQQAIAFAEVCGDKVAHATGYLSGDVSRPTLARAARGGASARHSS